MKTIVYYFTGTGNSLSVAKKIVGSLENYEIIPISTFRDSTGSIVPDADQVGIVCPVYFTGLPVMVAEFAKRLDLSGIGYIFSVVTNGGGGGRTTLTQLDELLKQTGRGLSAGYSLRMPGNYILMYEPPTGKKQDKLLKSADTEIQKIIGDIRQGKAKPVSRSLILSFFHSLFYNRFVSDVHNKDRLFTVSDTCISCGICVSVCPAANIELVDKKPIWKHHCELCCGCIHICPVQAIQAGKKTHGRARYRNPDVSIPELQHELSDTS